MSSSLHGIIDVSVIVPAYNEARHISKCLDSLLRQDFDSFEVVVVDDGSVDGTSEVVKQYVLRYPGKVRLLRLRKNLGAGNARNIGALYARGKVITFLDADMEFPSAFLSTLVGPILKGLTHATCSGEERIVNTDNPWVKVQAQRFKGMFSVERTGFVRAISRELFLKFGGYDARFGYFDDQTLHLRTGITAAVVKEACLYHYNPDTAREVLWRNFWIGRSVLRAHKLIEVLIMAAKRLIDISPPAALLILLTGHFLLQVVGAAILGAFVFAIVRHRVLEAGSVRGRLVLRLFYVPAYRFLRASGFIAGLLYSLAGRGFVHVGQVKVAELVTEFTG
jgi:glycosyltransferase involved in cell wall biosynthesis